MRTFCLYFPRLEAQIAVRERPELAGRAFVVLAGHGDEALVAGASCEAAARGVLVGMTAGQARYRCTSAAFLPDNAGACLDELERVASILRLRATSLVAIGGRHHLFVDAGRLANGAAEEGRVARRLCELARAWTGFDVRAGVGSGSADALSSARSARRLPVVAPPTADGSETPAYRPEPLVVRIATGTPSSPVAVRATLLRAVARMGTVLEGRQESFREMVVTVTSAAGERAFIQRAANPCHDPVDTLSAFATMLTDDALHGATGIAVSLERRGPDCRVRALPAGAGFARRTGDLAGLRRAS